MLKPKLPRSLVSLTLAAAPTGMVAALVQSVSQPEVASAANIDCGSSAIIGPAGVIVGPTGYLPHVESIGCPAGTTYAVYAYTKLYKYDGSDGWVQIDPSPSGNITKQGVYQATAQHTWTCPASPTNYCDPNQYKQIWQALVIALPDEITVPSQYCQATEGITWNGDPANQLYCTGNNYYDWS